LLLYVLGFAAFAGFNSIPGGWTASNPRVVELFVLGMVFPGFFGFLLAIPICLGMKAILQVVPNAYKRRHPSARLLAYLRALCLHELYTVEESKARKAAHEAEQALLQQKRSYWDCLNGYEFEIATAEILKRHQFNPNVTGGSADGGIDIKVTRGGHKGVVQCKAHVACVSPHVVRDLYG